MKPLIFLLCYFLLTIYVTIAMEMETDVGEGKEKVTQLAKVIEMEPTECIICLIPFPVMQKYVCGHEICVLCFEKIIDANEEKYEKCAMCRKPYTIQPTHYQTKVYEIPDLKANSMELKDFQKALPFVCKSGNLNIVKNWLALGLNPEEPGIFSYFPVHLCSTKELLEYFEKELKVNVFAKKEPYGFRGLYYSSELGYLDAVKYWIEKGAEVDEVNVNQNGFNALMTAARNGHFEVVKYLVEDAKADVNLPNFQGAKPIMFSALRGHLEVFEYLLEKTDKVTKEDLDLFYCLSAQEGHLNVVRYLLEKCGVDKNADHQGANPFTLAAQNGHMDVVRYLIQKKAYLFKKSRDGYSPLELAEKNGHSEVYEFLLKVENENNFCAVCQDWAPNRCSGCKTVYYCGKEHQADHWKRIHKNECNKRKE